MNGILVIDKPKDYTSRDIVNIVGKKFNTKKVGHTGTLDPLATGVLVICLGEALKLVEVITSQTKEYVAKVVLGLETDTLDITGKIIKDEPNLNISKPQIELALHKLIGKISQQVPAYSAVKVNGKKLYEYARQNIEVELPTRTVEIYNLSLITEPQIVDNHIEFDIKCKVSKGTYIRSLIRDIGTLLNTTATMKELRRTKQGDFNLDKAYTLTDLETDNYKLLSISEVINFPKKKLSKDLLFKIQNGQVLPKFFEEDTCLLTDENEVPIAIYKTTEQNPNLVKPWKMFKSN